MAGSAKNPQNSKTSSTLFLAPARWRTGQKLRSAAMGCGLEVSDPFAGVIGVDVPEGSESELSAAFSVQMLPVEREETRCRLVSGKVPPTHAELMHTQLLSQWMSAIDGLWLGDLLQERRLLTYFQPIVHLDNPGQVFAYECLLRANDNGTLVFPDRLYGAARATGQMVALDEMARLTAIESAARSFVTSNVFINFCPRSVDDPMRFLHDAVRMAGKCQIPTHRLVFEVVESDEIVDPGKLVELLDEFRAAGFRVALDDLGAGYSSLNLLTRIKPDFVKLDMDLIRNVDTDYYKSRVAAKLLELARELRVTTVVEGVETEAELNWSREHGADFAQGYLIARPAAVPPKSSFALPMAARPAPIDMQGAGLAAEVPRLLST